MVAINSELATGVQLFLQSGDRGFLDTLRAMDRNSIEGQSVVRYLMQLKHWPMTPESDFDGLLNHFFAAYPERKAIEPSEYRDTTFALIKSTFDYECVVVVPEPKAEVEHKPNPGKVTRRPKMVKEEDDKYAQEAPEADINTDGASDRLKRVIGIQRAG